MKTNKFTLVKHLSIGMGLALSFGNIISASPSFANENLARSASKSYICSGNSVNQNCLPKNGNFRLMQPPYSVDPRTGGITVPQKELPKPEPRPINEGIPSNNFR
jgi:hypothetical protein